MKSQFLLKKMRITISDDIFEEKKELDEKLVHTVPRASMKTSALNGRTAKKMKMNTSEDMLDEKKELDEKLVHTVLRVSMKTSALNGRTAKKTRILFCILIFLS